MFDVFSRQKKDREKKKDKKKDLQNMSVRDL